MNLGLTRILDLLAKLNNPHEQFPVIHVAGTNGKGSVCSYLSSVLTEAGYRTGKYTSPHLIDWTERICINEQAIASDKLSQITQQVQEAIDTSQESPTQFEVITAAAWLYFAQEKVDIAVMEVGLGGRLDATNVCQKPLATVITSISREHWRELGSTITEIAGEKAGIIKPGCPVVMGQLPEDAKKVVISRSLELQSPLITPQPATEISPGWAEYRWEDGEMGRWGDGEERENSALKIQYPLPLKGQIQLHNSALALATLEILKKEGWQISEPVIIQGFERTKWPGRMQWFTWKNHINKNNKHQEYKILIDGAHNPASAEVLRKYVDTLNQKNITWVMGMLANKDHSDIFQELLKTGDRLYLVPVPDSNSANLEDLKQLAFKICPDLDFCSTETDVFSALDTACTSSENQDNLVVLCGSLYLIGNFLGNCH